MSVFKRTSFWFSLLMLAIPVSFVIMAISYPAKPQLFPLIIGIPTSLAGAIILASEKWPKLMKPFDVADFSAKLRKGADGNSGAEEVELTDKQKAGRIMAAMGWMASYITIVFFVGFNPANFLIPALYIRVHAKSSWLKTILMGVGTAVLMWAMFDLVMQAQMWKGIFFGEIMPQI